MGEKIFHEETNTSDEVTDQNKSCSSNAGLQRHPENVEKSIEYTTKDALESKNLPAEQQQKIAELSKKLLKKKHQQKLFSKIHRQQEELRDLKRLLKLARKPFRFEDRSESSASTRAAAIASYLLSNAKGNGELYKNLGVLMSNELVYSERPTHEISETGNAESVRENGYYPSIGQWLKHQEMDLTNGNFTDEEGECIIRSILQENLCNRLVPSSSPIRSIQRNRHNEPFRSQFPSHSNLSKSCEYTNDLYKTELCDSFMDYGYCQFQSRCHFAHGQRELRLRPIENEKYKTEWCDKFLSGYCPYGKRCRFVHHISEKRILRPGKPFLNQPRGNRTVRLPGSYVNDYKAELLRSVRDINMSRRWNSRVAGYYLPPQERWCHSGSC